MRLLLPSPAHRSTPTPASPNPTAERIANDAYALIPRLRPGASAHRGAQNFDWDSTSLDGRVTTTLVALRPGLDSVILDAGNGSSVTRRRCPRARHLRTTAHGDTLVVYIRAPDGLPTTRCAFRSTTTAVSTTVAADVSSSRRDGSTGRKQIWSHGRTTTTISGSRPTTSRTTR